LDLASLNTIPISYASCSIGFKPDDTLPKKLDAISITGFTAIELSFPDILSFGKLHLGHEVSPTNYDELCKVSAEIKKICDSKGLKIMMLQPFSNFEGWPEGSDEKRDAFDRAHGWIRIMEACGTDMLQVGSSDTALSKLDQSRIVPDLRSLADLLAKHGFRLAYENWCWSSHAPCWRDVWDIVRRIDRPNVGLCLDTFQTAGGEWGDPTTASGLREDVSREQLEKQFEHSLEDLIATVPKDKIYLLQISDAYKPPQPLSPDPDESGLAPRGRWSHDFRPLPFNGGYLPVVQVTQAVLKTGFRGWFSYEVFDSGPDGEGISADMLSYVETAVNCQEKLLIECTQAK
ncbi:xylose isomerase-like protein, partial [Glonium stellatum]